MRHLLVLAPVALLLAEFASPPKRYIPPPLRAFIPFEAAWSGMHLALETKELKVVQED